jgi:hypothetical protein
MGKFAELWHNWQPGTGLSNIPSYQAVPVVS